MRYEDENVWLTQKMMAALYDVSIPAINQHLKRLFSDNELEEAAVVKQYLIAAADGENYQTKHYSHQALLCRSPEQDAPRRAWSNGGRGDRGSRRPHAREHGPHQLGCCAPRENPAL
jgi:hypothetical protein